MNGKLIRESASISVPAGLTYFQHDASYLVVNPETGGRCRLTEREFSVLRALSAPRAAGQSPHFAQTGDTPETERALARLILSWVVYHNGNKPTIRTAEPPLRTVYYAITEGCNLRCPYCYASSEKCLPGELSTAESLDLVSQVAAFDAKTVVFTGGEPMLRKDLFQIVEHTRSLGLEANIITNATMIRKPETAQRFAELFDTVTISLDGGTAAEHDRTRGKGAFAKTYRAIQLLNDVGIAPQINHILTSDNVDSLEEFATVVSGLKVASVRLMNHTDLGRGVDDEYYFGWTDHLRTQQIIWTSPVAGELLADGPRPAKPCSVKGNCGMGGNEIYVNSIGDVYPCKLVTGPGELAGNVREKTLSDIFASPVLRDMRTSTVFGGDYHEDCARCYIKPFCGGGCRATHMSESGDLKRNSRHLCRILRHGIATQLWTESGITRAELAANDAAMTIPRLVSTDEVHQVYGDWQGYQPATRAVTPEALAPSPKLIPITPIKRSPVNAIAD